MNVIRISDPRDPRVADYAALPDHELLHARGIFVAEGRLVVERLVADPRFLLCSLLVNDAAARALGPALASLGQRQPNVPIYICAADAFPAITGFDIHRGCLALARRPADLPLESLLGGTRLLVLEGVTNADNVGGLFRNAAAFSADGVVLSPTCCDPLYRKAIRTSVAATLRVPFARAARWPDDLQRLHGVGFMLVALTPNRSAITLDEFAGRRDGARLALLLGTEGPGLSDAAERAADVCVRIPIRDDVDSLNVAVAGGIALSRLSAPPRV